MKKLNRLKQQLNHQQIITNASSQAIKGGLRFYTTDMKAYIAVARNVLLTTGKMPCVSIHNGVICVEW